MMTAAATSAGPTYHVQFNGEQEFVAHLIRAATEAGVQADPISIMNFYVALKSKPLAILVGPAQGGKIALVQSLAHVLTAGSPLQCQMMGSRTQWDGRSGDAAFLAEVQTRLNADKILALIEEAWQPENAHQVFIGCLTRISPVELAGFFSEVAFQLRHGQIMRLPTVHLAEPIPYPPNLLLIGTIDAVSPHRSNDELLSQATIVHWPGVEVESARRRHPTRPFPGGGGLFLDSCVRNVWAAGLKLRRIQGWRSRTLRPLFQIEGLLKEQGVRFPHEVVDELVIYLANAWSGTGIGLFSRSTDRNLAIALDLAIAQTILSRVEEMVRRSAVLWARLRSVLNNDSFPRSAAFLEGMHEPFEHISQANAGALWGIT